MKEVLIIEDDPTIGRIYEGLLRKEGIETAIALDGEAALETILRSRPDLILLDVMLPKLNGVEVLKWVRGQSTTRDLPVIVFSNAYLSRADEDAFRLGPTQRFVKCQTTPKQLIRAIRSALGLDGPSAGESGSGPVPSSNESAVEANGQTDAPIETRARRYLLDDAPACLAQFRSCLQQLMRSSATAEQAARLQELQELNRSLSTTAALAGFGRLARICSALEALTSELRQRPAAINESSLRTVAQAIDFVGILFDDASVGQWDISAAGIVLVVDDEPISRRAVCAALMRTDLQAIELADPRLALQVMETNRFDLMFLDVDMPGMTGFELCQAARVGGRNKATPIVFVTGLADFANRALSIQSGGNDLIAKPFLGLELAVKALVYLLRTRSGRGSGARESRKVGSSRPLEGPQPILC